MPMCPVKVAICSIIEKKKMPPKLKKKTPTTTSTTLHCTQGSSNKFYKLWIEPGTGDMHSLKSRHGRIGANGQLARKAQNVSLARCLAMKERLIKAKQAKGYRIISEEKLKAPKKKKPEQKRDYSLDRFNLILE